MTIVIGIIGVIWLSFILASLGGDHRAEEEARSLDRWARANIPLKRKPVAEPDPKLGMAIVAIIVAAIVVAGMILN